MRSMHENVGKMEKGCRKAGCAMNRRLVMEHRFGWFGHV